MSSSESARARAAASSIASGRPSRSEQIAAAVLRATSSSASCVRDHAQGHEQVDRVLRPEWGYGVLVFPVAAEELAARREDVQAWAAAGQLTYERGACLAQVLAVVEDESRGLPADPLGDLLLDRDLRCLPGSQARRQHDGPLPPTR